MKPLYSYQGHSLKVKKGKVWLLLDWWNNGHVPAKYVEESDIKIVSLDVGLIHKNSSTGYQVLLPVTLMRTKVEPGLVETVHGRDRLECCGDIESNPSERLA